LVFVGGVKRHFAALFVGGSELRDFADRQFNTLEKCRLGRIAVTLAVQAHISPNVQPTGVYI